MRKINALEFSQDFIHQGRAIHVILDKDCRFTCATQYSAELCGYKRWEDMVGTTVFDFPCMAVEHAPEFHVQDRKVIEQCCSMRVLNINQYDSGEIKFYLTNKKPLINSNNEIVGLETSNTDLEKESVVSQFCMVLYKSQLALHAKGLFKGLSYEIVDCYCEHGLSKCQSEILFLLGYGKSAKQIAELIYVSSRTVEDYIEKLRWELGVQTKSQLTEYAIVAGLVFQIPSSLIY